MIEKNINKNFEIDNFKALSTSQKDQTLVKIFSFKQLDVDIYIGLCTHLIDDLQSQCFIRKGHILRYKKLIFSFRQKSSIIYYVIRQYLSILFLPHSHHTYNHHFTSNITSPILSSIKRKNLF